MKRIKIWLVAVCCMLLALDASAQKDKRPDSYNYQRAVEAFEASDHEVAQEYLGRELKDNPKNGYAHTLLALIYFYGEDYGRALNAVEDGIKYLPKKDNEYQVMAHLTKVGVQLILEDTTQALNTLTTAIKNYPKESDLYEHRAQLYYELGQLDASDADYRTMVNLKPGDTMGYMGLGRNANERKQWEDAIKQFDHVVKLSSGYSSGYAFRAESEVGLKKWDEATDDIVSALNCDYDQKAAYLATSMEEPAFSMLVSKFKVQSMKAPNDASWHTMIGLMYEGKNQYEKAIEAYNTANNKDADEAIHYRISHCYYNMGKMQQALASINQALNMDSTDVDDMAFKAEILNEMGDHSGAVAQIDKVIAEVPEYDTGYYLRGLYKRAAADTVDALEDMTMAIVLNPKVPGYYYSRGNIYDKQGKKELAEADYKKVIELESKPEDYQFIPYAYMGLGEQEKALAVMDTIIARDSTAADGYYNAACLYSLMNNLPKAIENLRKSMELGYLHFGHISRDSDLDNIRESEEFKALIDEFKKKSEDGETAFGMKDNVSKTTVSEVPFVKEDGVCKVKCQINGLPLHFIFDTGASDVTLSMVEATFMVKNGYLSDSDVIGNQRYMDANGNVTVGTVVNLKNVVFGEMTLNNVRASVVRNQKAPLLLGQSVLGRLGKVEIDNTHQVLKITHTQDF